MVDSYSERLAQVLRDRNISVAAFARRMGVSYQAVKKVVEGGMFGTQNHLEACRILKIHSDWLAEGKEPRDLGPETAQIDPEQFAFVRRAAVEFSNGVGKVAYEQDDKPPLVFRRDFLRKLGIAEGNAVVVDGTGHSNVPKIPEGAVVLVNKGDTERLNGDFFAFRVGEELLIKRLEMLKGIGVLATAENVDYKPKTVVYRDTDGPLDIIGRAVWVGSTL